MRAALALMCLCARAATLCAAVAAAAHLSVSRTSFVRADGTTFQWRGISAFRLAEFVAHGRTDEAESYLTWASSKRLTVVRVLTMADVLFTLSSSDGQRALSHLLDLANSHGLYVEVVALADTAHEPVDARRVVQAIGAICARHDNCLLELANEPGHPTQARTLHDPAYLKSLARLVPAGVPVSLGSVEYGAGFGDGTYVTWHAPRAHPVASLDEGAVLLKRFRKPVISDEPVGAAETRVPGRRENDPDVFRQMARRSKQLGLGATFHYEGGLQARIPTGRELACFEAWLGEMLK